MDVLKDVNTARPLNPLDNALSSGNTAAVQSIFTDIEQHLGQANYRWQSKGVQNHQENHLAVFRRWVSAYLITKGVDGVVLFEGDPKDANDGLLFSAERETMIARIKAYVKFLFFS